MSEVKAYDVVASYELLCRVGGGRRAEVWWAQRVSNAEGVAREAAIKLYRSVPNDQRQQLLQLAEGLTTLDHPNIVHVRDVGESKDGRCHLIMDFVDGLTLAE